MTGQELKHELTRRWEEWPDALPYLDVYISTDKGQRPLAVLDYDKENHRIVMVPEARKCIMNAETYHDEGEEPTPPPIEEYSEASVVKEDEPWLSKEAKAIEAVVESTEERSADQVKLIIIDDIINDGPIAVAIKDMR